MPGIKPAVADHLKVFFRDMPDETLNKFNGRECFLYISTVFMAVVMKSDILPVIMVNAGGCNYGPAKISADIFDNGIRVTFVRFCVDIETIFRVRAMAYFVPQEGQKRLWQRKGTNLRLPQ